MQLGENEYSKHIDKWKLQLINDLKWVDDTWYKVKEFYDGPSNVFEIGDSEKGQSNEFLVLEHG